MSKYIEYLNNLHKTTDKIELDKAFRTNRTGASKVRDKVVFTKMIWAEAMTYLAILQTIVIFTALVPQSIETINEAFKWVGIPFEFPTGITSVFVIILVGSVFLIGWLAFRVTGAARRQQEVSTSINPVYFMFWKEFQDIKDELKRLEEKFEKRA